MLKRAARPAAMPYVDDRAQRLHCAPSSRATDTGPCGARDELPGRRPDLVARMDALQLRTFT